MLVNLFNHHYYILLGYLFLTGFLSGFVDAVAGGGGLISVPSLIHTGLPMAWVFGTNKLQSSIGTSIATYNYYKGGLIKLSTVYRGLIAGLAGALTGAIAVNHVSNQIMSYIVPYLMLLVFACNLYNKDLGVIPGKKKMSEITFFSMFGFVFGFYDAFFGPGVGNFWVIAIIFFLGYTFLEASGYAKILNLKSNLFALCVFLYYGKVNFIFGFVMSSGSCLGGFVGAKSVIAKGSRMVRPFFIIIVGINVLMMFYSLIFSKVGVHYL